MNTIGQVGRSYTGTPAREPDETGTVERDGVRVHWERFGDEGPAILLLPTWSIIHSRHWKAQFHYLARHFRVVTWDGRGNGLSDRPAEVDAYAIGEFVADGIAVMDAAGLESACLAGLSMGGSLALKFAATHPDRVAAVLVIGPTVPNLTPTSAGRPPRALDEELEVYEGWDKFNGNYWRQDHRGFLEFFFGEIFCEPHSTKQIEDCVAFGLETDPETLIATQSADWGFPDQETGEAVCRAVRCPVVVIHGTDDHIQPFERGARVAELTGGQLCASRAAATLRRRASRSRSTSCCASSPSASRACLREHARGHGRSRGPSARCSSPRRSGWDMPGATSRSPTSCAARSPGSRSTGWPSTRSRPCWRSAARPSIRRAPSWPARPPTSTREAGEHDLHAFQALRRLDEIFCANFMVFHDVVRDEDYDLWIGDEAWELDHFLHENPELKTAAYAWLTDFVGYLPMAAGRTSATAASSRCSPTRSAPGSATPAPTKPNAAARRRSRSWTGRRRSSSPASATSSAPRSPCCRARSSSCAPIPPCWPRRTSPPSSTSPTATGCGSPGW